MGVQASDNSEVLTYITFWFKILINGDVLLKETKILQIKGKIRLSVYGGSEVLPGHQFLSFICICCVLVLGFHRGKVTLVGQLLFIFFFFLLFFYFLLLLVFFTFDSWSEYKILSV